MGLEKAIYNGTTKFPAGIFDYALWPLVVVLPPSVTPNKVTLSRLALMPVIIVLIVTGAMLEEETALITCGASLLIVALLMDALDGAVARYRNKCTPFGSMLDPMVDKGQNFLLLVAIDTILAVGLFLEDGAAVPWWYWVLLALANVSFVLCEGALAGVRIEDYNFEVTGNHPKTRAIASTWPGKVKMFSQSVGILLMLWEIRDPTSWVGVVGVSTLIAATPFAIMSLNDKYKKRSGAEWRLTSFLSATWQILENLARGKIKPIDPR